jgi:hypothetical protein
MGWQNTNSLWVDELFYNKFKFKFKFRIYKQKKLRSQTRDLAPKVRVHAQAKHVRQLNSYWFTKTYL